LHARRSPSASGADIIVIDDPLKPEEALSEAQRQAANEWYDHTLYSRLNDKRYGAIVIVMQRLGGQIVNRIKSSTVLQAIV
jgi:hypothetical protein